MVKFQIDSEYLSRYFYLFRVFWHYNSLVAGRFFCFALFNSRESLLTNNSQYLFKNKCSPLPLLTTELCLKLLPVMYLPQVHIWNPVVKVQYLCFKKVICELFWQSWKKLSSKDYYCFLIFSLLLKLMATISLTSWLNIHINFDGIFA